LIEVIVAGIDSLPKYVVFFATKELKEGEKYRVLPVED
jgi:hypothetical protein